MNRDPIIFAMANPDPEITPDEAKSAEANIIRIGRSHYPNQVNNVLAFPGLFQAALDTHSNVFNEEMKLSAAYTIVSLNPENKLGKIILFLHLLMLCPNRSGSCRCKNGNGDKGCNERVNIEDLKNKTYQLSTIDVDMKI